MSHPAQETTQSRITATQKSGQPPFFPCAPYQACVAVQICRLVTQSMCAHSVLTAWCVFSSSGGQGDAVSARAAMSQCCS